ncbi:S9 family peptidase [Marinobacter maroccanus]|uniref:S9 family peptidase n=1 Tax=Marinobacter maroccanus TaxID=2055143 RepID=A0A2S5ZA66_9GAMM|nr:prolyl oligopeptidase family serine peptidase [Marinobacter maroccanus]PPI84270.1 S9 family peptidase [Marinobacter maroccanus]
MRTIHGFSSGVNNPVIDSALGGHHHDKTVLSAYEACSAHIQRGELTVSPAGVFWLETDPARGCNTLWHLTDHGPARLGPQDLGIRSRVNGYGGGAVAAGDSGVFVVGEDQQIRFVSLAGGESLNLTDDKKAFYGGLVADPSRNRVLAVREAEGQQQLVAVSMQGDRTVLHAGQDFYSAPAISADGRKVAWTSWQLPDMPWLRTRLWTANLSEDGLLDQCREWPTPSEASVQQPVFDDSQLWVLSDHEGWWQPWRIDIRDEGGWHATDSPARDHANAPWQLGESHHCPTGRGGWARVRYCNGTGELWLRSGKTGEEIRVARDFGDFRCLQASGGYLYCIGRAASRLDAVIMVDLETGEVRTIAGGEEAMPGARAALPLDIEIPGLQSGQASIHGFFYTPKLATPDVPPLILIAHGGPTSAAYPVFNPQVQYWCQRGFAVAEINYRGSSGFGRAFRLALEGRWGEVDVEDMERAADHLASFGLADGQRVFIQGRSSGGYTALMAMIRSRRFTAGASMFGVTDPLRLRAMTHRFESGYLDWLLGAPGEHLDRWRDRTPLYHADRITAPMIFFQGGQDKVVVPEQTRAMIDAMKAAGRAPELHWFEDEGHGFRRQSNQAGMLEWTFSFYRKHSQKANEQAANLS